MLEDDEKTATTGIECSRRFVKERPDCQTRKGTQNQKPPGLLHPIPEVTLLEKTGVDILGFFRWSRNGKTVIIVATDYATRWAEIKALPSAKACSVAKFMLQNIITRHGAPRNILNDRGKNF